LSYAPVVICVDRTVVIIFIWIFSLFKISFVDVLFTRLMDIY